MSMPNTYKSIITLCVALMGCFPLDASAKLDEALASLEASAPLETPADSVKTKADDKSKGLDNLNFNPEDFLFQPRYVEQGAAFRNRFLDHLYAGFVTGMGRMVPRGQLPLKTSMPFGAMVGYDFNRLHGLRATVTHTNFDLKNADGTISQWEGGLDYVFNLTNYLYGYNKQRLVHISPTLGVSYIHSALHGEKKGVVSGQVGLNVGLGLGRNARFFIEPYAAAMGDAADFSGQRNLSRYDIRYGIETGLTVNLDNTNDFYGTEVVYTRGFFYELAQGLTLYNSPDLDFMKTMGTGYRVSVGRWFDPVTGLRLSAHGSEYYWSYDATAATETRPAYDTHYKGSMFAMRLEGLVNPLNFIPYWRRMRHPFELNVAVGGEYGWMSKYIPKTENGLKTFYAGFTGAISALYNMDKETAFFIEPRITIASFREPYINADRSASFTETSGSLFAGVRICAANKNERKLWPKYIFEKRLFTGVQVGGLKQMRSVKTVGDFAPNYSANYYIGVHLGRLCTLKGAVEYASLTQNSFDNYTVNFQGVDKTFSAMWHYRYNFLNYKLSYMLNLSNVYQRFDLNRKFHLYLEAGGMWSSNISTSARLGKDEMVVGNQAKSLNEKKGSAPAVLLAINGKYKFNDYWSILFVPEVNYYLKDNYLGGIVFEPFNDVVVKFNVGASYTF